MPYIGKQLSNGNYLKLDDISSSFNGSTTTFSLTNGGSAYYPGSEFSILVSVGGVIQEPESAYQISNDEITFANAPTAQDSFFCVVLGDAIGINVPGNNTVNGAQMAKPFNYDGGLLYLNDADNRVGINSTSPSAALDVVGDLNVSGNISGIGGTLGGTLVGNVYASSGISTFNDLLVNGDLTVQGDTTTLNTTLRNVELLRVSAASTFPAGIVTQTGTGDILSLRDNTTEVFKVADGGNVEINAASLTLVKTSGPLLELTTNTGAADATLRLSEGSTGSTTNGGGMFYSGADNRLYVTCGTNSTTKRISINRDDGNVGINTDFTGSQTWRSGQKLEIFGGSGNVTGELHIGANRGDGQQSVGSINFFDNTQDSTHRHIALIEADKSGSTSNKRGGDLIFFTKNDNVAAPTEKLRIASNGRVGIGSEIPSSTLDVAGGGQFKTNGAAVKIESSPGTNFTQLQLVNSGGSFYIGRENTAGDWFASGTGYASVLRSDGAYPLIFRVNSSNRLTIKSDGNIIPGTNNATSIGDGTTNFNSIWASTRFRGNDNVKLVLGNSQNLVIRHDGSYNIIGSPVADDLHIKSGTLDNDNQIIASFKHSNGSVGIGTTNPTKLLELYGTDPTIKLWDSSGDAYALIEGDSADQGSIRFRADPLSAGGTTHIRFDVDGDEALRITSDGYIGINDTSGNARLIVKGDSDTSDADCQIRIYDTDSTAGSQIPSLSFWGPSTEIGRIRGTDTSGMRFYTHDGSSLGERLRINSAGTVRIKRAVSTSLGNDSIFLAIGDTENGTNVNRMIGFGYNSNFGTSVYPASMGFTETDNSGNTKGALTFNTRDSTGATDVPTERLRITSAGQVRIGNPNNIAAWGQNNRLQVAGTDWNTSGVTIAKLANSGTVPNLVFGVSRGTSPGTAISNGDRLGYISFTGDDGTDMHTVGAAIIAGTDAAPSSNSISGTLRFYTGGNATDKERLHITSGGNVNIGGNLTQTTYTMRVTGSFAATTKSFVIDHPTKENHKLRYACLEGPENSVYVRGRSSDPVIELPDYWVGLVHDDSITVNVTPIGNKKVWVESINNNSVTIGSDDSTEYFYTVFAERKDVEKLEVEVEN